MRKQRMWENGAIQGSKQKIREVERVMRDKYDEGGEEESEKSNRMMLRGGEAAWSIFQTGQLHFVPEPARRGVMVSQVRTYLLFIALKMVRLSNRSMCTSCARPRNVNEH